MEPTLGDVAEPKARRAGLAAGGTPDPGCLVDTPAMLKMLRLQEHIEYAQAHGVLADVDAFLRSLPEEDWAHLGDF
jgi:hypothetical protein